MTPAFDGSFLIRFFRTALFTRKATVGDATADYIAESFQDLV